MTFDDVVGLATLVVCVAAIFLARRGARKKLQAAYAQGARDVSARSSVAVHVGDTFGNVGSLIHEADGTAGNHGPSDDHPADAARITLRRSCDGRGVLDVPNAGSLGTSGLDNGRLPVAGHPALGGRHRLDGVASPVIWPEDDDTR